MQQHQPLISAVFLERFLLTFQQSIALTPRPVKKQSMTREKPI
jgi:hypothetical protein